MAKVPSPLPDVASELALLRRIGCRPFVSDLLGPGSASCGVETPDCDFRLCGANSSFCQNERIAWAAKGVWVDLFAGGAARPGLIDNSAVKARRSASGGKGGAQSGRRPLGADATPAGPFRG